MARLSKAEQERNTRLKALMHQVPEGTDISKLIFGLINRGLLHISGPAPDRHAAIVCGAAIEHALKKAISLHLALDADLKGVFEDYPSAPISSFSDRTAIARALGVIDDATVDDLNVIRRIRNTFAHSVLPISFDEPDLAHLVGCLKRLKDPTWDLLDSQYENPRDRYVISCALHYTAIWQYQGPPRLDPIARAILLAKALRASPQTPLPPSPQENLPEDHDLAELPRLPDTPPD